MIAAILCCIGVPVLIGLVASIAAVTHGPSEPDIDDIERARRAYDDYIHRNDLESARRAYDDYIHRNPGL